MKKLTPDDPEGRSPDIAAENLAKLKALFPEIVSEGPRGASVNVDVLKALVGDGTVTDAEEKYGLNWHGKRRARQLALTPSTGTLRPCPEESVDWDTTQNLMIEGDNLEVLKLLQKSYAGKVKLIYIDPPYNTGKDFVYPDNFQESIQNYLDISGQSENARAISTNTESGGRFHTRWLDMMLPRLKLAWSLLREDGALFVSVDDGEVDSVKRLGCELFGEECFVGVIVVLVNPRGRHLDKYIAKTHDYVVVFVKDPEVDGSIQGMTKEGGMLEEYDREDERGKYRLLGLRNRNQAFNPRTRPNLFFPLYIDPATGQVALERGERFRDEVLPVTSDGVETCWTWGRDKIRAEGEVLVAIKAGDGTWRVSRKDYLHAADGEIATTLAKSLWLDKEFTNDYGRKATKELLDSPVFDFPKAPKLLQRIVAIASSGGDIVLDFFAGSGTTGQSVLAQNAEDGGKRRYVLVQFPEPLDPAIKEQKAAADYCDGLRKPRNIAELMKERVRRASRGLGDALLQSSGDLGFRVFKLDSTNLQEWKPKPDDLDGTLLKAVDHVKADRTEADLLYEVLLKLGLDLCVPIEARTIAGKAVQSVGGGVLMACLAERITREDVEALGRGIVEWRKALAPAGDTTCIFRDAAFADDVAKTNLASILEQNGIKKVRSL